MLRGIVEAILAFIESDVLLYAVLGSSLVYQISQIIIILHFGLSVLKNKWK